LYDLSFLPFPHTPYFTPFLLRTFFAHTFLNQPENRCFGSFHTQKIIHGGGKQRIVLEWQEGQSTLQKPSTREIATKFQLRSASSITKWSKKPEAFRPGDGDSSNIDPFTRKKEDIPSWTTIETSRLRRTYSPVLAIFEGKWLARDD
jgi:hypothetical protein